MKKKIAYIICVLLLFIVLWLNNERPINYTWKPTYDTEDKQPYGAYALDKLLEASWEKGYTHCYKSISDLKENGELDGRNLLIITEKFVTTESEIDTLLEYIHEGGTALIAANLYEYYLSNKLNFKIDYDYDYYSDIPLIGIQKQDTVRFCAPELDTAYYKVPAALCRHYFQDSITDYAFVAAKLNDKKIMMLRYQIGEGSLLLSYNPLLYTNYVVLSDSANGFIWNSLAYLQSKPLIRTEYYHLGSNAKKSKSLFRYLQSEPPLKWALNITIATLIVFMFFTAKRKQKAIPVVAPPKNKLLDFVRSVAGLYLRRNNNADIILKKKIYWADSLKRNYGMDIINEAHNADFYERLSAKTNTAAYKLSDLFSYLDAIDENTQVTDAKMMEIITQMNAIK